MSENNGVAHECNCELCQRATKYFEIIAKLPEADRKWMNDFYGRYLNESDERDYYICKWKGTWPYTEFMKCPKCGHNIDRRTKDVHRLYNDGEKISPLISGEGFKNES